jgi:hypothetical protein
MELPPLPADLTGDEQPSPHQRFLDEIAHFLADWPLYRTYKYKGDVWIRNPGSNYSFSFPGTVRLYCSDSVCGTTQVWTTDGLYLSSSSTVVDKFQSIKYQCRNCQRSSLVYFLHFNVNQIGGEISKVGQWPPLSREPDRVVVAEWDDTDKLLYRDAMTFRNATKGIGALPYLRRIIENHIHDVLDLILAANERRPIPGFDQVIFKQVRNSHRFSEKLDFARDYLPSDLTPAGCPNPIGTLYELISDGLHARSEEECIEIFDRCKIAFEYVVKKLTEAKREDETYIDAIRKLKSS